MKLSKHILALTLALTAVPALAQYEGTDTYERIRRTVAPEDTTEAQGNVYSFQNDYASQNYKDAYTGWKYLIEKAPLSITGIYKYGPYVLSSLITAPESTAEQKTQYLADLMHLFDVRLNNLAALNSFDKYPASEGDVLTYKAYWYYHTASGIDPEYNYNKIYDLYKTGITSVATMGGADVSPAILYEFFTTSKALYDAAPAYYYDQFLLDYVMTTNACTKMVQNAKALTDTAEQHKMVRDYDNILLNVDYIFKTSPAANPDTLVAHYAQTIEQHQGDYEYLMGAIAVMDGNGCTNNEPYYDACQYAYDIEPTYQSTLGMARKEVALEQVDSAKVYYEKALSLTDDPQEQAKICESVASSLAADGQIDEALVYADRIAQVDSTNAGLAAWARGEVYSNAQQWDKAIEALRMACEKDVTYTEQANRLIAQIDTYKENVAAAQAEAARRAAAKKAAAQAAAQQKARQGGPRQLSPAQLAAKAEYDKKMAEYKRKKAEYDKQKAAFDAKKKADDAFWSEH